MNKKNTKRLAKFSFWLGILTFFFVLLDSTKTFKWLFGFELYLERLGLFIDGICIFLLLPKTYIEMVDEERENPRYPDYVGRKCLFGLFFMGAMCIVLFFTGL